MQIHAELLYRMLQNSPLPDVNKNKSSGAAGFKKGQSSFAHAQKSSHLSFRSNLEVVLERTFLCSTDEETTGKGLYAQENLLAC